MPSTSNPRPSLDIPDQNCRTNDTPLKNAIASGWRNSVPLVSTVMMPSSARAPEARHLPRSRLLTGRTGYAELSALTFDNVRRSCDRGSASAPETRAEAGGTGDAGKTEGNAKANSHRDGIGKTSGPSRRLRARKSDRNPARASRRRPAAAINAPRRQAGHTKALDPTPGIGQGKIPCRRGRSYTKALLNPN